VRADRQPDHVLLAGPGLFPVSEDRSPVGSPGHLEASRPSDDALHPQTGTELPLFEIDYEMFNGTLERGALLGWSTVPS
jgi:hypothetical protein